MSDDCQERSMMGLEPINPRGQRVIAGAEYVDREVLKPRRALH